MCHLISLTVAMTVVAVAYLVNMKPEVLFPDSEEPLGQGVKSIKGGTEGYLKVHPKGLDSVYDAASGEYNFGRYAQPPKDASLHTLTPAQYLTQHKEWHWSALYTDTVIIGMATLQFGYASHAISYYYNIATDEFYSSKREIILAGLPLGAKHRTAEGAPSSPVNGCSKWWVGDSFEQCGNETVLHAEANVTASGGKLLEISYDIEMGDDESLSFVYPIGKHRPAVVSKLGGNRAKGHVALDGERMELEGVAMVDWTRSLAARLTVWNWAALSFSTPTARIGVQISAGVYEDPTGNGVESCFIVNGKVHTPDVKINFDKPQPEEITTGEWHVTAADGSIEYTFTPKESVGGAFRLYVLDGDLQHIVGKATGKVTVEGVTYSFENIPAVMEEHYALW